MATVPAVLPDDAADRAGELSICEGFLHACLSGDRERAKGFVEWFIHLNVRHHAQGRMVAPAP